MTDYRPLLSEPLFWVFVAILIILVIVTIWMIIRLIFIKREDHVGVYFESNFRGIINEWDLINRPTLKEWKLEASKRLKLLDKDLTGIEKMRSGIDSRLSALDKEIAKVERY